MTEDEARAWVDERFDHQAVSRLEHLVALVLNESNRQNLISRSTLDSIWARHLVDSLQLIRWAPDGPWMDIGTGAGFPGLAVAAALPAREMVLVEPRRLRVDYLRNAVAQLHLDNVTVVAGKVEAVTKPVAVISARAVATISSVLNAAARCSTKATTWLLPKGRNGLQEVAQAQEEWHGVFHVKQSITNLDSSVVVAQNVRRK